MKKLCSFLIVLLFINFSHAQSVGIGTITPNPSAQLDVSSTTKGFLPPRMTYAQRNSILNPVAGLVVYCTDCDELQVYNGIIWKNACGGAAALPPLPFPSVTICNQVWMVKNLDVSTYRNGDVIPQITDPQVWNDILIGAWCWYNNDSATYSIYGKLYNYYAVNDPRGLAPTGWHIPADSEWTTLTTCLGGELVAGALMKETGTIHWLDPNSGANNFSGFTALPGGDREVNGGSGNGNFEMVGYWGIWWSSTADNASTTFLRNLFYNSAIAQKGDYPYGYGLSVRCTKD
jgi:uncharacterized protein (TIGR02145 family)